MNKSQKVINALNEMAAMLISKSDAPKLFDVYFKEFMSKYFPEHYSRFPKPKFILKKLSGMAGFYRPKANELTITTDLLTTPSIFKQVVFHELIHFADDHINGPSSGDTTAYYKSDKSGHGKFFQTYMNTINSKEGSGFITVTQDSAPLMAVKEFYVYFARHISKDAYIILWSKKAPTDKTRQKIDRMSRYIQHPWYIAKTDLIVLQLSAPLTDTGTIKASVVSRDSEPEIVKILNTIKKDVLEIEDTRSPSIIG